MTVATDAIARLFPAVGRAARGRRWHRQGPMRIWAHRGASAELPENTLPAFVRAREAGADGVELDVRLTRDQVVVVFHDDTTDRLCGVPGTIEERSHAEVQALRVKGHPIPTLAETFEATGGLEVNVEIKTSRPGRAGRLVAATAQVIGAARAADRVLVSSFDPWALIQLHAVAPTLTTAYLFHAEQPKLLHRGRLGYWLGASALHPEDALCTAETVAAWHRKGFPVNVWTVDDPARIAQLASWGVDGVFCNDPAAARRALATSART